MRFRPTSSRVVTPAVEAEQRNREQNGYWVHWLSGAPD